MGCIVHLTRNQNAHQGINFNLLFTKNLTPNFSEITYQQEKREKLCGVLFREINFSLYITQFDHYRKL